MCKLRRKFKTSGNFLKLLRWLTDKISHSRQNVYFHFSKGSLITLSMKKIGNFEKNTAEDIGWKFIPSKRGGSRIISCLSYPSLSRLLGSSFSFYSGTPHFHLTINNLSFVQRNIRLRETTVSKKNCLWKSLINNFIKFFKRFLHLHNQSVVW